MRFATQLNDVDAASDHLFGHAYRIGDVDVAEVENAVEIAVVERFHSSMTSRSGGFSTAELFKPRPGRRRSLNPNLSLVQPARRRGQFKIARRHDALDKSGIEIAVAEFAVAHHGRVKRHRRLDASDIIF